MIEAIRPSFYNHELAAQIPVKTMNQNRKLQKCIKINGKVEIATVFVVFVMVSWRFPCPGVLKARCMSLEAILSLGISSSSQLVDLVKALGTMDVV